MRVVDVVLLAVTIGGVVTVELIAVAVGCVYIAVRSIWIVHKGRKHR